LLLEVPQLARDSVAANVSAAASNRFILFILNYSLKSIAHIAQIKYSKNVILNKSNV